jgi:hypothetical protein
MLGAMSDWSRDFFDVWLTPLQIYGTTGKNWDAFLGRHIPLK